MKNYIAFISYSRKDKTVADWLHCKLEKYVLPDKQKANSIFQFESKYFRPVFLDTQDLHIESRPFTDNLQLALKNSEFLIVLCSKSSVISDFVDKEIHYFLETHNNNWSKIVPLFLDEVNDNIPPSFKGSSILERHFPIYNTRLSKNSEANNYCFYQIISYILGIDFSTIYNRYEIATIKSKNQKKRMVGLIIVFLLLFILTIGLSFYRYKIKSEEVIEQKQKLIEFEKKIFPQAIVCGYEKNFLTPVIKYLKQNSQKFTIYILMPQNERELTHQNRVEDFLYTAKMQLDIDSIPFVFLPTETKRGSRIMQISYNGHIVDGIYIDFATTTTSFLDIANYKKHNEIYKNLPIDSIIQDYAYEFKSQTYEKLKFDSVYVKFFFDKNKLIEELKLNISD